MDLTREDRSAGLADATLAAGAAAGQGAVGPGARFVLPATVLGSAMVFIDGNVVSVALPAIEAEFAAGLAGLQWVVEGYLVTLTALLLTGGAAGDRFGRRRAFAAGTILFALASAACGLAPGVEWLVAARAMQGVGGALLVPGSLAIITAAYPEGRRGRAIGAWSAWSAVTVAIAPVLGGWLVDEAGWRWIFWINLPLALAVLALLATGVPESRATDVAAGLDVPGAALATAGLALLVVALIESPRLGALHPIVALSGLVGLVALIAFIAVERRSPAPMLPPGLFRSRTFLGANLLTLALYAGLGGALFFLPLHLINQRGYSALAAGAAMLPFIALLSLLSRRAGVLVDRHGARPLLIAGPALAGCGMALFALPPAHAGYWSGIFPGMTLLGLGMALAIAPLTTAVMNAAPPGRAGIASAVNNAVSRVAFLIVVAGLGAAVVTLFRLALPPEAAALLGEEALRVGAARPPAGLAPADAARLAGEIAAAAHAAFRLAMLASAAMAFAAAAIAAAMLREDYGR
jgi:EmrB/QacA subfamily drug resistance transporter